MAFTAVAGQRCFNGAVFGADFKKCYNFFYSPLTAEEAEAVCSSIGGQLVSINSPAEQAFISGHARLRFVNRDYWIGLTDFMKDGYWTWSDGSDYALYSNWDEKPAENSPKWKVLSSKLNGYTPEHSSSYSRQSYELHSYSDRSKSLSKTIPETNSCVAATLVHGTWYSTNCNQATNYFVCQTEPVSLAPAINKTFCPLMADEESQKNKCLHFISSFQTYSEAELTCGSIQGRLVNIKDADEMWFVTARARQKLARQDYWIGLTDFYEFHKWRWDDESIPSYLNWAHDEPSNERNNSCVASHILRGNWYNDDCEGTTKYFVCETVPVKVPFSLSSENQVNDWIFFKRTNSWYKALPTLATKSWEAYEKDCQAEGAHLASIHSSYENSFVYGIAFGDDLCQYAAIGLKSLSGNVNNFEWNDETVLDFNYWDSGKPPYENKFCTFMRYHVRGPWYNFGCDDTAWSFCAVCKKPATLN